MKNNTYFEELNRTARAFEEKHAAHKQLKQQIIDTLRKAGIETLVVTNQSTGLMEDLHGYAAEGCTMLGLCTITKKSRRFGEETEEQIMGIRFKLN